MYILGISALYHDSAAALLCDGELVAAAQEERFTRVKYDHRFPAHAIAYCLRQAGITARDLEYVVFYEKPLLKFERILLTHLSTYPRSWQVFREAMIAWFREKLWVKSLILNALPVPSDRVLFVEHHLSHAASALYCSPFREAAVLTVDGVGEWTTTALGRATADWGGGTNRIDLLEEMRFPHSLGLLYSTFTAWLGFKVNSGEYKLMGMAPYGQPRYMDKLEQLIRVDDDGSFRLNMEYFSYHHSLRETYNDKFIALFGPPRRPGAPFFTSGDERGLYDRAEAERNQYYADVAASVQRLIEEILLKMAVHLHRRTGLRDLVIAGGVALNSVANGRMMREGPFERVFIQPNAGDAGGALGAALYGWHVVLGNPRRFVMEHAYYGEEYAPSQVRRALREHGIPHEYVEDRTQLVDRVVDALTHGQVVGLFQGRFEWGPRALGNRSILADPRRAEMKDIVNTKIKFREPFRPFAPAVTEERAPDYFALERVDGQYPPRFMLIVAPVRTGRASEIPAVTHMGTGRLQTVRRSWNPLYYDLIRGFGHATGVPVLLNTSFNLRGEPIVASPGDALKTFSTSGLDLMVMGDFLVHRPGSPAPPGTAVPSGLVAHPRGRGRERPDPVICPACGDTLRRGGQPPGHLECSACGRRFPVDDWIPLLYWPTGETHVDSVTKLVKEFYSEHPFPGYEGLDTAGRLTEKARAGIFARLLDDQMPDDALVLECGCGTGQLSNFLALRGRTVFGTDICLNSLKMAREFSVRNAIDSVHFVQMNLFRPVFPAGSFDYVICNGVLHHTDDPRAGFETISRLVRPGGYVIVGLYNRYGRLWTDIRRVIFRMSGNRFQFLDPYLARTDVDDAKKRIWFADQYQNPYESRHTQDEVLEWFAAAGFEFVNAMPKPVPFARFSPNEPLFHTHSPGSRLSRVLAQLQMGLQGREGGFFVMIGRKKNSRSRFN